MVAVDRIDWKLDLAAELGATHIVNSAEADVVDAVRNLTGGGVHHAFEAVGLKETTEQAFAMLRHGGQATVIGMIPVGTKIELPGDEFIWEKTITGSNMGSNQFRTDIPRYIDMYLDGRLNLDAMVSNTIHLEEINDGFEAMKDGNVARTLISFS